MSATDAANLIVRAARRARSRDNFMAWLLARYQDLEQCDESRIAANIEMSPADMPKLALCLRPRQATFVADIGSLAKRFNCSASKLANLVRLAEAADVMQTNEDGKTDSGLLIAARKRNEKFGDEKHAD